MQRSRLRRGSWQDTVLLAAPALVLYAVFVLGPLVLNLYYSLTSWNGVSSDVPFVGLQNYERAMSDNELRESFAVTTVIAVCTTLAVTLVAVPLAVLLNRNNFVTRVYRSIVFFPIVLSPIVVGFIWQTFLNTVGVFNKTLGVIDAGPVVFLGDKRLAVVSVAGVAAWQTLGFITVLYLAALQSIPTDLYEAARVDGAGSWRMFRSITLPLLAPAMAANSILMVVIFMRIYEYVVAMTGGGPAGATQTVAYLITQQAFTRGQFGYAATTAVLLVASVSMLIIGIRLMAGIRARIAR